MSADWQRLSRDAGLRVDIGRIEVVFRDQRRQFVFAESGDAETIRIWSIVAKPSALVHLRTPVIDAWRRNRLSELVGFTVDGRGRMIGEAWVPTEGLDADEWAFYLRTVARACDRFEYLLTGSDVS
jgi:hypothetical protein